jgi:hypothetical protein
MPSMIQYAQIIKEYQRVCQCLVCSSELRKAPCRTSLSNPSCCRTEYLSFDMFLAVRFWRCELQQLEVKHGKSAVKQCKTCAVWLSSKTHELIMFCHVHSSNFHSAQTCSNCIREAPLEQTASWPRTSAVNPNTWRSEKKSSPCLRNIRRTKVTERRDGINCSTSLCCLTICFFCRSLVLNTGKAPSTRCHLPGLRTRERCQRPRILTH